MNMWEAVGVGVGSLGVWGCTSKDALVNTCRCKT
jgi:hypothetical protein